MAEKILVDLRRDAIDMSGEPVMLKAGDTKVHSWADVLRKAFLAMSSPDSVETTMRYMGWCQVLDESQGLELSAADLEAIQTLILKTQHNLHLKGPLIMSLKAAKAASEEAK